MRLSWNEIRARAAGFAAEFADATYEKGETQTFYNAFFQVFGVKRRSVGVYESRVKKLSGDTGFIDLFWPQVLLVEQKSTGRNLSAARVQAEDYFLALKEHERPRYILACDFQTFDLYDLSERTQHSFRLADLPDHVERFGFIMGVQKVAFKDQDPVNIKAAELVGNLHDKLEAAGFKGTDLERFLVRIVFCLFADDTGVFQPRNLFLNWLEERTAEDGHDLGPKLSLLFQTLDTEEDKRGKLLDEDMAAFPYVNGDLFDGATKIPSFNTEMREALLSASRFDWSPISPAIFGSLFQSVMNKEERRKAGAHYTTEKNILKVINPLFMDGLRAEFARAKALTRGRRDALEALHRKLGTLTFFDPACGCGNFL
ncbi:MAG: class I SAM-dependent DNA methyltransferase, partial [Alphaproteobacteria bacterium]|nr:class I SAM-dependent DNA methyltransferase [Alphaproteobacteria bacterium]